MNYSNPALLKLRSIGQKYGILRPVVGFYRRLRRMNYEDRFDRLMLATITSGSVVWDVGANVGFYSQKFLEKVGATGKVVAFEPAPMSARVCAEKFTGNANFQLEEKALAGKSGVVKFSASSTSHTNKIVDDGDSFATEVAAITGDEYADRNLNLVPTFIKMDVEGFELEALQGLARTLERPTFKALFLEMHFLELAKRGLPGAPREIVASLKDAALKIRWIDPSHLIAFRGHAPE